MSEVEQAASHRLRELIEGGTALLSPVALYEIATWATLKALCFDLLQGDNRIAMDEDFHDFHNSRAPSPGLQVWAGSFPLRHHELSRFSVSPMLGMIARQQVPVVTKLFWTIGELALDITFAPKRFRQYAKLTGRPKAQNLFKTLWPASDDVSWPPLDHFTDESWSAFSRQDLFPPVACALSD